jgi:hypothetical protein
MLIWPRVRRWDEEPGASGIDTTGTGGWLRAAEFKRPCSLDTLLHGAFDMSSAVKL